MPTILGEVKRFFRDNAWVVRPPRRIQELQAEISAASARLTHESGRVPSPAMIAAELGTDPGRWSRRWRRMAVSRRARWTGPAGRSTTTAGSLADVLGDDDPGFAHAEALVALRPLCQRLSERDRRIIYLRFFHEWTQARIAQEFGVTQMQVSRLLSRILRDMRNQLADLQDDPVQVAS